jgi:hypothetical protein
VSEVYSFLPWVRQGLNGAGLPADSLATKLAINATVTVDLKINQHDSPIGNKIHVAGPADVIGIDPRQVVRCDPAPSTRNFEPNFLASIEFDRPDFPWMFTPASADAKSRLRPWLCLIVVKNGDGVQLKNVPGRQLRVLEINDPADELPELSESWAWAHGQVSGSLANEDALDLILKSKPERTVSRLICPRRLQPGTSYIACVVPTFEAGRKAGLGMPLTAEDKFLKPAWDIVDPALTQLRLPVYYSWQFSTGPSGDFQALVELLTPQVASTGLGVRDMLVGNEVLTFEGALKATNTVSRGFNEPAGAAYRAALRELVDRPAEATSDPAVTPPIYAGRYFDLSRLPADTESGWLRELNLDPRYRSTAALGTEVIQVQQEALMASAWEQAGEIERANTILRNAQLMRAASNSVFRHHLSHMPESTLLQITRPVHGRVMVAAGTTIEGKIRESNTPVTVTSSAFRRIARPRGPILRRFSQPAERTLRPIVDHVASGTLSLMVFRDTKTIVTVEAAEAQFKKNGGIHPPNTVPVTSFNITNRPVATAPTRPAFSILPAELPGTGGFLLVQASGPDNAVAARFRKAVAIHQRLIAPLVLTQTTKKPLEVKKLGETVLAKLDPATTMPNLVRPLITGGGPGAVVSDGADELEPVLMGPRFPQPMYKGLRNLSQELLLPGLGSVEENSVTVLESNPRFVEAYMAGLNHEIGRELLWRGFATDLRSTPFHHFWDTQGREGGPVEDIPSIEKWRRINPLGKNAAGPPEPALVLLIRGELLRRYPTAIIYALSAIWPAGQARPKLGEQEVHPEFQGSLRPDVVFFGFRLTKKIARGEKTPSSPGFFFVIQEHPAEPRFGVEANDTSTGNLKPQGNAAQTAQKLLQRPVRIAIHARDLLPEG